MAPYVLKAEGKTKKISNHVVQGNQVLNETPASIGKRISKDLFEFESKVSFDKLEGFMSIDFENMGIQEE